MLKVPSPQLHIQTSCSPSRLNDYVAKTIKQSIVLSVTTGYRVFTAGIDNS